MALVSASNTQATRERVQKALTTKDKNTGGIVLQAALLLALLVTLLALFTLLLRIITQAWPALTGRGSDLLTDSLASEPAKAGLWPGLYGSFFIGLGVIVIAIPIGIAAAIYLEEYASQGRLSQLLIVNIRNLAGVPAVIYGVLGLTIFAGWLKPVTSGKTVIAAALTMSVLVLPVVIITASEAIRAVPQGLREAGYGVGATKWEVTRDHTIPYAMPGILTGSMLSLSRALGEAAPLILLGAITGLLPKTELTGKFTALPIIIFNWAGRPAKNTEIDWPNLAAAAGLVLLGLVLLFNVASIALRTRYERRRTGT